MRESKYVLVGRPPSEDDLEAKLQGKVIRYLKAFPPEDVWFFKAADKHTAGVPDLVLCVRGRFVGIELKVDGNTTSDLQELTLEKIDKAGGQVYVAYSIKDVKQIMGKLLTT
jgi:hypothetical protein